MANNHRTVKNENQLSLDVLTIQSEGQTFDRKNIKIAAKVCMECAVNCRRLAILLQNTNRLVL